MSRWRIQAAAAAPRRCQQRRSGRPESDRAPPCMRWRGPARPRRAGWPVDRPCRLARRPPGPGTRTTNRSPGSSHVPGVAPRWCPFPNGENISTAFAGAAQEPAASHFRFFPVHKVIHSKRAVIRICHRLSTGLFTAYPQTPEHKPENTGTAGDKMQSAELFLAAFGYSPGDRIRL